MPRADCSAPRRAACARRGRLKRTGPSVGEHLDDLLCLARADITTKRPEKKNKGLGQIAELSARIAALAAEDAVQPPLPKGVGDALVKAFALPPSPRIGQLKKALEAAVEAGEIEPRLTSEEYVAFVTANRARFGV